jgi:hypothetical protein
MRAPVLRSVVVVPERSRLFVPHVLSRDRFTPQHLMHVEPSDLHSIVREHLSKAMPVQRELNYNLVRAYHTKKRATDPVLAADELASRLFYEVLTRRLHADDVLSGSWVRQVVRHSGRGRPGPGLVGRHCLRMQILRCCIKKSRAGLSHMHKYAWIRFW